MFFWGYIEDVRREVVTDFNISSTPISTTVIDTDIYTSGGRISSETEHTTIWTFDIGDTSFKLISDTMHLKNGDFVVVESYSRDGVYYLAYCILNATKKYSEPSWFPGGYLNKRKNLPQKPRMIISHIFLILSILLFIFVLITGLIIGLKEGRILDTLIIFGIFGVLSYFVGRRRYNEIKDANYQYKRKLSDITKQNNWIEYRNAEYKKYENEISLAVKGFLKDKFQSEPSWFSDYTEQIEG
ncbi:hypothetical protein OFO27_05010 [Campylobacter sp. CS_ED1]|uniref:hypothetical protein n=1 Tax=Campylobacter sp. CS_ED1 TaxID=2984140 RepID=UPI0022E9D716|nr:hypothetical protein [Campylobacter sp. CS_ED1]MDA3085889.1 hypothetical protein [Campylobacter sp. CS_ED1]